VELFKKLQHKIVHGAEESQYQYTIYGVFAFFGFVGFYFANPNILAPGQYENFYVRLVAIIVSFFLIIKSYWPNSLKKLLPVFWYLTLTYNLPFFFTFMVL
jgi:hypothetical protein